MPYVFVFHYNSILPKYCNNALYSENKRYVLLKKKKNNVYLWGKEANVGNKALINLAGRDRG
jgi:hypothetical protein